MSFSEPHHLRPGPRRWCPGGSGDSQVRDAHSNRWCAQDYLSTRKKGVREDGGEENPGNGRGQALELCSCAQTPNIVKNPQIPTNIPNTPKTPNTLIRSLLCEPSERMGEESERPTHPVSVMRTKSTEKSVASRKVHHDRVPTRSMAFWRVMAVAIASQS